MRAYKYSIGHQSSWPIEAESKDAALQTLADEVERSDFPDSDPHCTLNVNVCVWDSVGSLSCYVELAPIEPKCQQPEHAWVETSAVRLGSTMKHTGVCLRCDWRRHRYRFHCSPDHRYTRYEVA